MVIPIPSHHEEEKSMKMDHVWLKDQVDRYSRDEHPKYELYSDLLSRIFDHACAKYGILGIVNTRAKAIPSFAEKVIRKSGKYDDPLHQLTDLCGARVITNTQQESDQIISFIRDNFRVDEENSLDLRSLLKAEEFGYRSVHYVVQLRKDAPDVTDLIRKMEAQGRTAENMLQGVDIFETIGDRKAEIQVRTLLQHAWAMISHDRFYKSEFEVPEYFRRELARVAALLESADQEFGNAINGIDEYKMNYGSYLTGARMREEVEKWEMVISYDRENVQLAHRIGQLSIAMEDWERALKVLEPFRESGKGFIFRDIGIALTRAGKDGRKELDTAVELDPNDVEAWCALGDSWKDVESRQALKYYKRAFDLSPSDPHILGSYLEARLRLSKNIDFVPLMHPTLQSAIETCQKLADAHVYLPWAFYDIAWFSLLLNRPYDCLNALTKAVTLSDSVHPITLAMESIKVLEVPIQNSAAYAPDFYQLFWTVDAVKRYLEAAYVAKLYERQHRAIISDYLTDLVSVALNPKDGPYIIVAGGCSEDVQEEMEAYRQDMGTAFECFTGTIICGASRAGISGIVGDIPPCSEGTVRKIGYVPGHPPDDFEPHPRYEIITSKRLSRVSHEIVGPKEFTPLEPIQGWIDLLAAGIRPWDVRVVGINGGAISAFEYRMALSFGATVGVLKSSGRSAAELQSDSEWWNAPKLLWLPKDKMAMRAFVNPGESTLEKDQLERVGQVIHEKFLEEHRYANMDPAMMPWEELRDDLKQSNRAQAVYAAKILRSADYEVRESAAPAECPEFTDGEVERMAEMEHGRWIVERLRMGWSYGPNRDPVAKVSPYLTAWKELPEEVKEYDRRAVRDCTECLKMAGLDIYRPV